jgi:hypothetical protein
MIYKEINIVPELTEYIVIAPESVQVHKIFNKTHMDVINDYTNYLVRGMEHKIFYPSVSKDCNECPYKNICTT